MCKTKYYLLFVSVISNNPLYKVHISMQSTYCYTKYIYSYAEYKYLCNVHIAMQSTYIYAKYIYLCKVHIAMPSTYSYANRKTVQFKALSK